MRLMLQGAAVLGLVISCLGCATVVHRPLDPTSPTADAQATGIRYYNSSPYVLVYANAAGGLTSEIHYLADPHRLMTARPKQYLSSLDATLEFENGVLSKSDVSADAAIVPKAILEAAKTAAAAIAAQPGRSESAPAVEIFKPVQALNGDFLLVGGPADGAYHLTGAIPSPVAESGDAAPSAAEGGSRR